MTELPLERYKMFNKYKNLDEIELIKKIVFYCTKAGYVISFSSYDKLEDIINDANKIRFYGNEASVRRAIKLLNRDNKLKNKIEVVMSDKCRARLDRLEKIKKDNKVKFKVTKSAHIVRFQ